jgi:hypothetical protein
MRRPAAPTWYEVVEPAAPNIVAAWRGIDEGRFISVRREVRRRSGPGTGERLVAELGGTCDALVARVNALPAAAFGEPGGEGEWNVAQAAMHTAVSRAGLVVAASLAAGGRWPRGAPRVIPGIPGPPDASRDEIVGRLRRSQAVIERKAGAIAGHETDPCPLEHPLVGRLRCGEWVLFAGVHDLMHLEQLEAIAARLAARGPHGPQPR